ncbi:hypothetical protein BD324DRAFT_616239 [Kockovaella imperatae]|uniref:Right handed beta helix domain-containing protein n=1 Tax=Kockovaella imperatae TaxID=4999 RepID=A0A1Y1URN8_9TREE|nr:hypothetical protein BD324DRAFT_616239 [Kockovaella imperatae]ORX40096.1 hypothetical protein BD324DRAFT_616239 [Kockovaella imperatae]
MLLSSLALVFLPIVLAARGRACLPSGDERAINEAFQQGGSATQVVLCAGSTHLLNDTIRFTSSRQTLTTEGNPKGRDRAMLVVKGEDQAVAIKADCADCSFATIRSLIIDGNRPEMLRVVKGGALIEIGNAETQTVRDCRLYEPRGWSCLHVREGDRLNCRKARIVANDIGPCGEEWDDEYDGEDETNPVNGNPRADGISLACQDSYVERNVVTDATDGAIVIFGSSGSEIRDNQIFTRTRVLLGGINLVDYDPYKGDYFGVKVHHNAIHAHGGYLKAGIVIGPSAWSDDTNNVVHSAWVTDNTFHGGHFGYAMVVASAERFTVLRNELGDDVGFGGAIGVRCPKSPPNAPPMPFLLDKASAEGNFQDEFVNGMVQHVICLDPPPIDGVPYKPWRLRDSPHAKKRSDLDDGQKAITETTLESSFDSRLAEAVVLYQQRVMTRLNGLNDKLERHNRPADSDVTAGEPAISERGKTGIRAIDGLERKMGVYESQEKSLQNELDALGREINDLSKRFRKATADHKPILSELFNSVNLLPMSQHLRQRQPAKQAFISWDAFSKLGPVGIMLGSGTLLIFVLFLVRRLRRRSTRSSKDKTF